MQLNPNSRAMAINHKLIVLNKKFRDMGIWVCQECSSFNNAERAKCKYCDQDKFIVEDSHFEEEIVEIPFPPKALDSHM